MGRRSVTIHGILWKCSGQYACYDSFRGGWWLGPKHLAERFPQQNSSLSKYHKPSRAFKDVVSLFPSGDFVDFVLDIKHKGSKRRTKL